MITLTRTNCDDNKPVHVFDGRSESIKQSKTLFANKQKSTNKMK